MYLPSLSSFRDMKVGSGPGARTPPRLHAQSLCSFIVQSKSLGHFISPSHDAELRAEPLLGAVPGNTTLASCKERQVPGSGTGSVQGTDSTAGGRGDWQLQWDQETQWGWKVRAEEAWPEAHL